MCGFDGMFWFVREQDMATNVIDFGRQRGDILIELSITECKWIGIDWCVSVNRWYRQTPKRTRHRLSEQTREWHITLRPPGNWPRWNQILCFIWRWQIFNVYYDGICSSKFHHPQSVDGGIACWVYNDGCYCKQFDSEVFWLWQYLVENFISILSTHSCLYTFIWNFNFSPRGVSVLQQTKLLYYKKIALLKIHKLVLFLF